jgi:hypothetical protein
MLSGVTVTFTAERVLVDGVVLLWGVFELDLSVGRLAGMWCWLLGVAQQNEIVSTKVAHLKNRSEPSTDRECGLPAGAQRMTRFYFNRKALP